MKIKIDKQEYEDLLARVESLEAKVYDDTDLLYQNWMFTRGTIREMMDEYFKTQCATVIIKRDKNKVVGELKKLAVDNLFKEEKCDD